MRDGTFFSSTLKILLTVLLFSLNAQADGGGWNFLYEKDGFRTYERKGHPRAYKAEGSVEIPLAELAAVLVDIPRQKEWVNTLVESRLIEGDPLTRSVIYSRYNLPWPAKDRDAVVESVVEEDVTHSVVRVRFRNTTSPAAPPHSKCIRVPTSEGEFILKDTEEGAVLVTYTILLDPGGWLPNWIVHIFVQDAPVTTLRAFKAQVLKTRGQYTAFINQQLARWAEIRRNESGIEVDKKILQEPRSPESAPLPAKPQWSTGHGGDDPSWASKP